MNEINITAKKSETHLLTFLNKEIALKFIMRRTKFSAAAEIESFILVKQQLR